MAVRFSEEQVLQATGAARLRESARSSFVAVSTDTRTLVPGALFVALEGERFDAHEFLDQAAKAGAAAAVVQKSKVLPDLPAQLGIYQVEDTLLALGALGRY